MRCKLQAAALLICVVLSAGLCHSVAAQEAAAAPAGPAPDFPPPREYSEEAPHSGFLSDARSYFTSPLHWDTRDWLYFGGSLAAIGAAHHYDDQVRTHFTTGTFADNLNSQSSHSGTDALPAVAVVAATWAYASLLDDSNGRRESGEMVESAVLSCATAFVLRFAVGRERPGATSDSTRFGAGGSGSFPSLHSTGAFAIGTILAESGSDDVRWIRRLIGYGLGAATSYERLRHNAHWLSDTVAGAALGIATSRFVLNRHTNPDYSGGVMVVPVDGGVMLSYSATF